MSLHTVSFPSSLMSIHHPMMVAPAEESATRPLPLTSNEFPLKAQELPLPLTPDGGLPQLRTSTVVTDTALAKQIINSLEAIDDNDQTRRVAPKNEGTNVMHGVLSADESTMALLTALRELGLEFYQSDIALKTAAIDRMFVAAEATKTSLNAQGAAALGAAVGAMGASILIAGGGLGLSTKGFKQDHNATLDKIKLNQNNAAFTKLPEELKTDLAKINLKHDNILNDAITPDKVSDMAKELYRNRTELNTRIKSLEAIPSDAGDSISRNQKIQRVKETLTEIEDEIKIENKPITDPLEANRQAEIAKAKQDNITKQAELTDKLNEFDEMTNADDFHVARRTQSQGMALNSITMGVSNAISSIGHNAEQKEAAQQALYQARSAIENQAIDHFKGSADQSLQTKEQMRSIMEQIIQSKNDVASAIANNSRV